nr:ribonuclease H-like domain-containing protein [Tanacetum cinerariifolium]
FKEIDGGYVTFGGNSKGGKISSKGKIKTGKLDFDDVYFLKELKFNLFSVSQIIPRENNMYNVDLKNVVPSGGLTFLFAKDTLYESNLWHRRLGHINFKAMNKLVKGNLVRGLPSTIFENNHTCVACQKGKQHRASYSLLPIPFWAEAVNTECYIQNRVLVTKPHNKTPYELVLGRSPSIGFMGPFGCPITILNTLDPLGKFDGMADKGFLVGYSVNCKAFIIFNSRPRIVQETLHINFLENKPNVGGIGPKWLFDINTLTMSRNYQPIVAGNQPNDNAGIKENLGACKVGKETVSAKKYVMLPLWSFDSQDPKNTDDDVANYAFEVKENENDVHVSAHESDKTDKKKHDAKATRDDKGKSHVDSITRVRDLRTQFEEFSFNNTNKVNAVSEPVNDGGLNLTNSTISFNTASPSVNPAFIVFNSRPRIVQETLHINFLENKPNVGRIGPKWLFDINTLTMSRNYQPIVAGNQPNDNAGIKENLDACKVGKETVSAQKYVMLPLWSSDSQDPKNTDDDVNAVSEPVNDGGLNLTNSTTSFNTASPSVNAVIPNFEIARQSSFVDPS